MQTALRSAEKGFGLVSPDPPVGCVVLSRQGRFLTSGHYACFGAPHAEMAALRKIKDRSLLKGAQLFVTLEPCAHFGKNPPCADALLKQPLSAVIYGKEDPNPLTQGRGIKKLKAGGMAVKKTSFLQKPLQRLYEAFALNQKKALTFFALKTASSLDGLSGLSQGESQWITGQGAGEFTARLRAFYDAVLIGVGTFFQDKPRLNSRPVAGGAPPPNKVCILDPEGASLDLITRSPIAKVRPMENIFVITKRQPEKKFPFKVLTASTVSALVKNENSGPVKKQAKSFSPPPAKKAGPTNSTKQNPNTDFDLKALSQRLYKQGIRSALVEGGAVTFSRFIAQGAGNRLYWLINPCLLGGAKGRYWTEELPLSSLKQRIRLRSTEILNLGEDILITGALEENPPRRKS